MVTPKAPFEINLDELLGPPAHIPRVDRQRFHKVHEHVRRTLKPRDFIGELEAREYAEKIFEEIMLKRYQADLIKSMRHISRNSLLDASGLPPLELKEGSEEEQIKERFDALGITDNTIEANAFNLQRDVFEILERLIASRSRTRTCIEKRAGKRSRSIDGDPADAIKADVLVAAKQRRPKRS